jgi:hypothetical protein
VIVSTFIGTRADPAETVKAQLPLERSKFRLLKVAINGEKLILEALTNLDV